MKPFLFVNLYFSMSILGVGLWASSGPFPLSAHYGLYKRGRDPPTNPSRHLKKERSDLPLKWLLKEGRGRSPTAAAATTAATPCPGHGFFTIVIATPLSSSRRRRRRLRTAAPPSSLVPPPPAGHPPPSSSSHLHLHLRPSPASPPARSPPSAASSSTFPSHPLPSPVPPLDHLPFWIFPSTILPTRLLTCGSASQTILPTPASNFRSTACPSPESHRLNFPVQLPNPVTFPPPHSQIHLRSLPCHRDHALLLPQFRLSPSRNPRFLLPPTCSRFSLHLPITGQEFSNQPS